mmetsp:Transcript_8500/g.18724  ORF Transcript_8500/g.18724 Transcript_8500/m.18724 type:complete len:219 (-) Transcript_8500:79-735(-)
MLIMVQNSDGKGYKNVYTLSKDGNFGSVFNNLPFEGDLAKLELFDNGMITVTMGKQMVWYYGSSVPSMSPSKSPVTKKPTPKPVDENYQTGLWKSQMTLNALKTKLSAFQIQQFLDVTKNHMEVRFQTPGYENLVGASFRSLTMSKPKQKIKKKKNTIMQYNLRFFYRGRPDESKVLKLLNDMFKDKTVVDVYKNRLKQAAPVFDVVTTIKFKRKKVV